MHCIIIVRYRRSPFVSLHNERYSIHNYFITPALPSKIYPVNHPRLQFTTHPEGLYRTNRKRHWRKKPLRAGGTPSLLGTRRSESDLPGSVRPYPSVCINQKPVNAWDNAGRNQWICPPPVGYWIWSTCSYGNTNPTDYYRVKLSVPGIHQE